MKKSLLAVLATVAVAGGLNTAKLEVSAAETPIVLEEKEIVEQSEIVHIPDENLKRIINNYLERYEEPDHPISQDDLLQLTYLSLSNAQIQDLTGLEYAKNLEELDINNIDYGWGDDRYNQIKDFSVISHLTNLKSLGLSGNKITNLSMLTGLVNLTNLDLSNNNITNLEELANLTNLINLTNLDLSHNSIINIEGLEIFTNLVQLDLSNNQIINIDYLTSNFNLNSLDVSNNPIEDISTLGSQKNLNSLNISDTKVKDASVLGELTSLISLGANNIELTSLNLIKSLINLTDLSVEGNSIKSLDGIENLKNIVNLHIGGNQITNFSLLNKLPWLNHLSVNNGGIKNLSVFEGLKQLSYLSLDNNHIQDITSIYSITEDFSIKEQTIELNSILLKKDQKLVLDNPLPGDYWQYEPFREGEGIHVKDGSFNILTNKLTWENVSKNQLEFTFGAYLGNFRHPSVFSGTVTIPVEFYTVPEAFDKLVENNAFTIVSGTGTAEKPLVLEIAQGTKRYVIEELIESYSDYTLTVSKNETRSSLETYKLTFTKGEEKVYFELKVHSSDQDIISYLENKVGTIPPTGGETTPPAGGETTPPAGGETTPPAGGETTPPAGGSSDSSEHPETGFSGLMGMMGLGALSLGAAFVNRKKK